jgi:elongation factor 2
MCEEPMRGVIVRFLDAHIHRDQAHRGSGQILPATRRVTYGAMLLAEPVLQEPFYQCDVSTVKTEVGAVYDCVARRRGIVVDEVAVTGSPVVVIKCHVPVATSFGLSEALRSATSGRAFAQCSFSHWNNCTDSETLALVGTIRKRKGLEGELAPSVDEFNDRL